MMEIDEGSLHATDYCRSTGKTSNNPVVIETIDISEYPISSKKRMSKVYDKELCKNNKPLTDFINKCILLDQTVGMEKIINKVMLPAYVKADTEYKQSEKFRRVVTKAFKRLINDPGRKYSHISDIVDTLKLHAAITNETQMPVSVKPVEKKRVNFVTLSTKVSGEYIGKPIETNRKRPIIESSSKVSPKKSKPEVIALDNDDDDDIIPIDDDSNQVVVSNDNEIEHNSATGADLVNGDTIEIQDSQELKIIEEIQSDEERTVNNTLNKLNDDKAVPYENKKEKPHNEPTINEIEHEKENLGSNENDENKLLVPQKERIVRLEKPKPKKKEPAEMTEEEKAKRIENIEAEIKNYNDIIAKLDLEEVVDDSANSPYFKRDRLQIMIVKLYKELCTLVGEEPTERRKIRFQIKEGVAAGPIKRLEKFLNKQTDADGVAPFPDFSDVIRCVEKANKKDGLGWSKTKVMEEAQELFTYCGRALQKRRQEREWKHLRAQVRPEEFEADPAEADPQLRARLEANRRIAKQREAEVFSKFTRMQTEPPQATSVSLQSEDKLEIQDPSEAEESSSEEEPEQTPAPEATPALQKDNNNTECPEVIVTHPDSDGSIVKYPEIDAPVVKDSEIDVSIVKKEPVEPIQIQYKGDISLVIEIEDSESDDDEIGALVF